VRQITQVLFLGEQREAANEGILLTPMKRSDDRPGRKQRRMTMMTTNTNEAFTDAELDGVNGGYSLGEFKSDFLGAVASLKQGIQDGYATAKQMLS